MIQEQVVSIAYGEAFYASTFLKLRNVARWKLNWIKEAISYWRSKLMQGGWHGALELHAFEVNYDPIPVVSPGEPKSLGPRLRGRRALRRRNSKCQNT